MTSPHGIEPDIFNISTLGIQVPIHQDSQEPKRKRNRLAQRKHRHRKYSFTQIIAFSLVSWDAQSLSGIKENGSTDTRQQKSCGGNSTHMESSSILEDSSFICPSKSPSNQVTSPAFHAGGVVSAMDFAMPDARQSVSNICQPADIIQFPIEAPFESAGAAFLPEDMTMQHGFIPQSYGTLPSEDNLPMTYQSQQAQDYHCSPPATEMSHARVGSEISLSPLRARHCSASTTTTSTVNSGPHRSHATSDTESLPSSDDVDGAINNDSPRSLPVLAKGSESAQSCRSETVRSLFEEAEALEARFERIIRIVEEEGFESIDDLSAKYYTTLFKEDSLVHWAQTRSRSRSLQAVLASLHASTENWSAREVQGYQFQITEAAESLYTREVSQAKKRFLEDECLRTRSTEKDVSASASQTAAGAEKLRGLIVEMASGQDFQRKRARIREMVRSLKLFSDSYCLNPVD